MDPIDEGMEVAILTIDAWRTIRWGAALALGLCLLLATPALAAGPVWTITPGPTSGFGELRDVYAASAGDAWAVGDQSGGPTTAISLAEHWDGHSWQVARLPTIGQFEHELDAVSGSSSTDVWAVGSQATTAEHPYPPEATVIVHWNGTSWARVPSPNPVSFINRLLAVKAFAPNDAWASGVTEAVDGQPFTDFTLHWDGASWTQVDGPQPMTVVGGSSGSDVWFMSAMTPIHWNGTSFTQVSGPVSQHVVVLSPTDAWGTGGVNQKPVITHWDGRTWSVFTTLSASANPGALAALSPTDVWTVGDSADANGNTTTLTMRFDGTSWSTVPSPNPQPGGFVFLQGVAAAAPGTVLAVGTGAGSLGNETFAIATANG